MSVTSDVSVINNQCTRCGHDESDHGGGIESREHCRVCECPDFRVLIVNQEDLAFISDQTNIRIYEETKPYEAEEDVT